MNILIIGNSGVGKSNFGDIMKNLIHRHDPDCTIVITDPSREQKTLGTGKNIHRISVCTKSESLLRNA